MKNNEILYLTNCYGSPDSVNVGAAARHFYHTEFLRQAGCSVTVITSSGSTIGTTDSADCYPDWVKVIQAPPLTRGTLAARLKYYAQNFLGGLRAARSLGTRPALVMASSPTLLIAIQGLLLSRRFHAKFLLDVRDLWADSLSAGRFGRWRWFVALNAALERAVYRRAHTIICTTEAQAEAVRGMVPRSCSVSVVHNGFDFDLVEDAAALQTPTDLARIREKYPVVAMFTGKHSDYTALDTLLDAATRLDPSRYAVVLVGGGYHKERLAARAKAEGISNVFFLGPVSKRAVYDYLANADVLIINYSSSNEWSRVLPNKLYDYLYFNKPVIAAIVEGEVSRILKESGAGIRIDPGDAGLMADAIEAVSEGRIGVGGHGREYLLEHFDRRRIADRLQAHVLELIG